HAPRRVVAGLERRVEDVEIDDLLEGPVARDERGLGRVALPPRRPLEPPADLDLAVRQRDHPAEPEAAAAAPLAADPQAEVVVAPAALERLDARVGLGGPVRLAVEDPAHDLGVGAERAERLAVALLPAAEQQPLGPQDGDRGHRSSSSSAMLTSSSARAF